MIQKVELSNEVDVLNAYIEVTYKHKRTKTAIKHGSQTKSVAFDKLMDLGTGDSEIVTLQVWNQCIDGDEELGQCNAAIDQLKDSSGATISMPMLFDNKIAATIYL